MKKLPPVLLFLPAYNAQETLKSTLDGVPKGVADEILLVDDASSDATANIARGLGLRTIVHQENKGYGGNLKTCLFEAKRMHAGVAVELHPDNQYDAGQLPTLIQKVREEGYDLVLGSRFSTGKDPGKYGMHWYRILANRVLSFFDRAILGINLTEFHTGFRAYSSRFLQTIPFEQCKDNYTLSFEVIAQAVFFGLKVGEIPVLSKYTDSSRSASILHASVYALQTLQVLAKFLLQKYHVTSFSIFEKGT